MQLRILYCISVCANSKDYLLVSFHLTIGYGGPLTSAHMTHRILLNQYLFVTHLVGFSFIPRESPMRTGWWILRESNPRPQACKASALPSELRAHIGHDDGNRTRIFGETVRNNSLYTTSRCMGTFKSYPGPNTKKRKTTQNTTSMYW